MATVSDRLTLNFDTTKFGDDLTLSTKAKTYLNSAPIIVSDWAKSDMANGSLNRSDYYVNPVASYTSSTTSNVNSIIALCVNDPDTNYPLYPQGAKNLANSCNNLIVQIQEFVNHTNRLSGVTKSTYDIATSKFKPDFNMAHSTGSMVLQILSSTDGVTDTSPILGNFTSLYVSEELNQHSWNIGNSRVLLQTTGSSTTSAQLISMKAVVDQVNTFIYTRRTEDETHFEQSQTLVDDYQLTQSISSVGSSQRNMINSLIGTDKLKSIVNG